MHISCLNNTKLKLIKHPRLAQRCWWKCNLRSDATYIVSKPRTEAVGYEAPVNLLQI